MSGLWNDLRGHFSTDVLGVKGRGSERANQRISERASERVGKSASLQIGKSGVQVFEDFGDDTGVGVVEFGGEVASAGCALQLSYELLGALGVLGMADFGVDAGCILRQFYGT